MLDKYVISKELMQLAGISPNAYRYWNDVASATYDNARAVFLEKETIHKKYKHLLKQCTPLDGLVQSSAFCALTNLPSSHLIKSNGSKIYDILEIKHICGFKFVNLQKFFNDYGLNKSHTIYIEKCHYFAPLEKKIKLTNSLCMGFY
jgi:hypothetical protein